MGARMRCTVNAELYSAHCYVTQSPHYCLDLLLLLLAVLESLDFRFPTKLF